MMDEKIYRFFTENAMDDGEPFMRNRKFLIAARPIFIILREIK